MPTEWHEIAQWVALAGAALGVWAKLKQRDDRVAIEIRRQAKVESDLKDLRHMLDMHVAGECKMVQKLDKLLAEIHDVRERMVRLETWIDTARKQ